MNYFNAIELERRIVEQNKMIERDTTIKGSKLCFFGSGTDCTNMLNWFRKKGLLLPVVICDNNKDKQGTSIENIPVISFQDTLDLYENLYVLITSTSYGNEIEVQILEYVEESYVLNITPFFRKRGGTTLSEPSQEVKERMEAHNSYLRGESEEKVPLRLPEEMPERAKEIVQQLEKYQELYNQEESIILDKDKEYYMMGEIDFWKDDVEQVATVKLCDYIGKENQKGIYREGEYPGYLVLHGNYLRSNKEMDGVIEKVTQFYQELKGQSIPFLYVQLPCKISPIESEIPVGRNNAKNETVTQIVNEMKEKGVPVLDYRQIMMERGVDYRQSFFKTDSHWKISTAFDATKEVCTTLAKITDLQFDFDKFNKKHYETILYPNILLGWRGKSTGLLYSGLDDLELILPKYETDYTWSCKEKGYRVRGSAKESLLNIPQLDWDYYALNPYGVYSLMNGGHCMIENHKAKEERKIICINDSFANPMASFLAPHFSELHFVDIRGKWNKNNVDALIEEVKPDVVVMLYFVHCTLDVINKEWI